jgi:hypothetical protein
VPQVHIDRAQDLETEELDGMIVRLVRSLRVTGLASTDYEAVFEALAEVGVPVFGVGAGTGAPNLVLRKRSVKAVDENTVDVILEYEHALNEGQDFDGPFFGVTFGETEASLNQVTTNLDFNGDTFFVEHEYPLTDPDFPGETKEQGGEIDWLQPQMTLKFSGIRFTNSPGALARAMLGKTNDATWNGGDTGHWLCTACDFKLFDHASTPRRYTFRLTFQYNEDGWDPTVVFVDERTGKPPIDLVPDVGYKTIARYEQIDFDATFGAVLSE